MSDRWELKHARLDRTATVTKLLREGYEPFWGIKVTDGGKSHIEMYFRKPPDPVVTELSGELASFEFNTEPLTEFTNQLKSNLTGVLDHFTERFFEKLDKITTYTYTSTTAMTGATEEKSEEEEEKSEEEEEDDADDQPIQLEREPPAGDQFRVVDEVPVVQSVSPTDEQRRTIESLKKKYGNVSILPGNHDGMIKVLGGADVYMIGPTGNFSVEETAARTGSL